MNRSEAKMYNDISRMMIALDSVAKSLEKIANPPPPASEAPPMSVSELTAVQDALNDFGLRVRGAASETRLPTA